MKQTLASLGRFAVISSIAILTATISNFFNYQKYWNGTIFAVQTVDFNILSHTLPTKLSIVLNQGNKEEIQRTLNSNYGLFGIVVTDCKTIESKCPKQKIIYFSQPSFRWQHQTSVNSLSNHPHDILRNPPPIYAEGRFTFTRERQRQYTGNTNSGEIIGRVYYVRNKPPTFIEDYRRWLSNPLATSGANIIYSLATALFMLGGLFAWRTLERVLYQKRVQQELAQQERQQLLEKQKQLLKQAQSLQQQLQDKIRQTQAVLEQRERDRAELIHHQAFQAQHVQQLEQAIAQYETQLIEQEEQQRQGDQTLEQLQQNLATFQQWEVAAISEIQQHEQKITILQRQLDKQAEEKQQKVGLLEELRQELQDIKERESTVQHQAEMLNQAIATLTSERDQAVQKFQELEQNLVDAPNINNLATALEEARYELEYAKKLEQYVIEDNEKLRDEKEQLNQKYDEVQLQVWDLEEQVKYYLECLTKSPHYSNETATQNYYQEFEIVQKNVDLSGLRLALVGGHPDTRREVIRELSEGCGLRDYVEVAPSSEAYISRSSVKAKISRCDLVVVITGYIGHDLSQIVFDLQKDRLLTGQILSLDIRGKSGIVREILAFVKASAKETILPLMSI